jgi:hypothetical protein
MSTSSQICPQTRFWQTEIERDTVVTEKESAILKTDDRTVYRVPLTLSSYQPLDDI